MINRPKEIVFPGLYLVLKAEGALSVSHEPHVSLLCFLCCENASVTTLGSHQHQKVPL